MFTSLLKKRNQFSKEKSFRLWNLYTLSSLYWTKYENKTIVQYDSLLNETEKTLKKISNELHILWPQNTEQIFYELNEFIDPKLRHSYSSIEQLMNTDDLSQETKILYPKLLKSLKTPSTKFNRTVDNLYHSLFLHTEES